jgi:AcrR family transcriptional regulator
VGVSRTRGQLAPLYRRLPHGPNGMPREDVARNQRTRLFGAMIESVAQRGYQQTTVAHVIGLAGVSRRAFYEHFANKEQCFLATHDIVVANARKRMLDAWAGERGWANRVHAACKTLLDDVARSPNGARLVLVESLGIGPRARERMQLASFTFERLVAGAFQADPTARGFPQLTSRTIVAGVRHVVFALMLERREHELFGLTDEVLDWVESYRTPGAARLGVLMPARPPRTPPAPAAFLVADDRRARVLGSVVHLTLDSGYASLTDPQIAQFAGISTEAFHRQFADKEECFLAVLDEFVGEALTAVAPSLQDADSWPDAVYAAMGAFVDYLVAHQALLRIAFVDVFEVGPRIIGRITRAVEGFTDLLTEAGPEPVRGPRLARQAVTGALWGMIASYVTHDRLARLPVLVDHLAFTVLAPYVGTRQAIETVTEARGSRRCA